MPPFFLFALESAAELLLLETEPFLGLPLVLVCDSIIESSLFSMFKTGVCSEI
jgi:hypothetical protein